MNRSFLCAFLVFSIGIGCARSITITSPNAKPEAAQRTTLPTGEQGAKIASLSAGSYTLSGSRIWLDKATYGERRFGFEYSSQANQLIRPECSDTGESYREWSVFGGSLQGLSLSLRIPFKVSVRNDRFDVKDERNVAFQLRAGTVAGSCDLQTQILQAPGTQLSLMSLFDRARSNEADGLWSLKATTHGEMLDGLLVKTESGFDIFFQYNSGGDTVIAQVSLVPSTDFAPSAPPAARPATPPMTPLPKNLVPILPEHRVSDDPKTDRPTMEVPLPEQDETLQDADVQCADPKGCPNTVGMLVGRDGKTMYQCSVTRVGPDIVATNSHCLPNLQKDGEYRRAVGTQCEGKLWILYPKTSTRPAEREGCAEILAANTLGSDALDNKDWAYIRVKQPTSRGYVPVSHTPFIGRRRLQMWAMDPDSSQAGFHGRIVRKSCEVSEVSFYRRDPEYRAGSYPNLIFSQCSPGLRHGNSGSGLFDTEGGGGTLRALLSAVDFQNSPGARGAGPSSVCMPDPLANPLSAGQPSQWNTCRILTRFEREAMEDPGNVRGHAESELRDLESKAVLSVWGNPRTMLTREAVKQKFFVDPSTDPVLQIVDGSGYEDNRAYSRNDHDVLLRDGTRIKTPEFPMRLQTGLHFAPRCILNPPDFGKNILFAKPEWPEQFREDYRYVPNFISPVRFQNPATISTRVKWFSIDLRLNTGRPTILGLLDYHTEVVEHEARAELTLKNYAVHYKGLGWYMDSRIQARWRVIDPESGDVLFEEEIRGFCN